MGCVAALPCCKQDVAPATQALWSGCNKILDVRIWSKYLNSAKVYSQYKVRCGSSSASGSTTSSS